MRRRVHLIALTLFAALLGFGGVLERCQGPNQAPIARFTFTPKDPKVGERITFDASASRDPDGKIVGYLWDFGDGKTATGVTAMYVFNQAGEYDVILQVTDNRNATASFAKTVRVVPPNQPPVGLFLVEPPSPKVNEEVTFDASASQDPDGQIVSYDWDFGDGSTAQGKIVKHTYKKDGIYKVKLTVADDQGATFVVTQDVTVQPKPEPPNQPPLVTFTFDPQKPKVNERVSFDATGSSDADGQIVKYEWDFGDGEKAEGQTTTHIYKSAGRFTVKLTVTDDRGATNSLTRTIEIQAVAP
ncbi:MAG: PKD domain-containing protein [Candidatus Bipolaricaulota bacterium]|nr:PKD domain-containing protein [Candidatus Bipolaricaulota bacterium]MCS7274036.1 PKD domain-containing protein [Candidatus Bipolaricaulota bacterium]MDW8110236.1 PKD domain-containing protein [Candidatus Bipolaricaulota bacterium]MDW8328864.1 PKD domain-containing protein [Candidatus Bipolaricaulota bacterium]